MPSLMPRIVPCLLLAAGGSAHQVHGNFNRAAPGNSQWDAVTEILQNGTLAKVFPGAVAVVGNREGSLFSAAVGNYTDDGNNPSFIPAGTTDPNPTPTLDGTRFDMASCTKVVATTSAVALLYQEGFISVDDKIQDYLGPAYATQGKDDVTILNCLVHNTGYPPDPSPEYWDPVFGCEGMLRALPSFQEHIICMSGL